MPGIAYVHWKDFEKFLQAVGCRLVCERSDHRIWIREGMKRPAVVQKLASLPPFAIKNNLRLLGVSVKEYLEIMKKV